MRNVKTSLTAATELHAGLSTRNIKMILLKVQINAFKS